MYCKNSLLAMNLIALWISTETYFTSFEFITKKTYVRRTCVCTCNSLIQNLLIESLRNYFFHLHPIKIRNIECISISKQKPKHYVPRTMYQCYLKCCTNIFDEYEHLRRIHLRYDSVWGFQWSVFLVFTPQILDLRYFIK